MPLRLRKDQIVDYFARLRKLGRRLGKDGLPAFSTTPLEWIAMSEPSRVIAYVGKPVLLRSFLSAGVRIPAHVGIFSRPGLVLRAYAAIVRREATATRARVVYVGDLSPLGITVYLSLLCGGWEAKPGDRQLSVRYAGIDDEWLRISKSELLPPHREPTLDGLPVPITFCTAMTEFEREHFRLLERCHFDVEQMVGRIGASVLRAGCTVQLDNAARTKMYRPGFGRRLLSHVIRQAALGGTKPRPAASRP
jgi:hypothetical protein